MQPFGFIEHICSVFSCVFLIAVWMWVFYFTEDVITEDRFLGAVTLVFCIDNPCKYDCIIQLRPWLNKK